MKKIWGILLSLLLISTSISVFAGESFNVPNRASVGGKYTGIKQILKCNKDRAQYGKFKDYGYWGGGSWCGKQGKAGYWVWVAPNWYVWSNKGKPKNKLPPRASVHGKYSGIKQIIHCRSDRATYGNFREYGYWGGGPWCGKQGKAGFWVYNFPNWYVWKKKH